MDTPNHMPQEQEDKDALLKKFLAQQERKRNYMREFMRKKREKDPEAFRAYQREYYARTKAASNPEDA